MTTADRRKVLNLLAEGKISADEAEQLLKALDQQSSGGPDVASFVEERLDRVTDAVERFRVDLEDSFERSNEEFDSRKFAVEAEPRIEVDNFNGRVEVRGGSSDGEVQVDAELLHPDRVRYSARQEGNTIRVESRPSGRRSLLGLLPLNRTVHLTLTVPSLAVIEVNSSYGRVSVHGVEGSGSLRTSNGRIIVEELRGDFNLTTSSSRIEARNTSGRYKISTSNGRVLVDAASGEYKIRTSNGQIMFDGELTPGTDNSFITSNGAIAASLGDSPNVRVKAATTNGRIRCLRQFDSPETRVKGRLDGTIGDGGALLKLRTSNGSITID